MNSLKEQIGQQCDSKKDGGYATAQVRDESQNPFVFHTYWGFRDILEDRWVQGNMHIGYNNQNLGIFYANVVNIATIFHPTTNDLLFPINYYIVFGKYNVIHWPLAIARAHLVSHNRENEVKLCVHYDIFNWLSTFWADQLNSPEELQNVSGGHRNRTYKWH